MSDVGPMRGVVLALLLLGALFSCSSGVPGTDAVGTTVAGDPEPTSTSTSAAPTTMAEGAAPPEIQGIWTIDLGNDIEATMSLSDSTYSFHSSPEAGRISVEGDVIEFLGGGLCREAGAYRWSLEGDTLTFTAVEPLDPCPERKGLLDGKVYTR